MERTEVALAGRNSSPSKSKKVVNAHGGDFHMDLIQNQQIMPAYIQKNGWKYARSKTFLKLL